jgi:hypothetical protein
MTKQHRLSSTFLRLLFISIAQVSVVFSLPEHLLSSEFYSSSPLSDIPTIAPIQYAICYIHIILTRVKVPASSAVQLVIHSLSFNLKCVY